MSNRELINSKTAGILGPIKNSDTIYLGWLTPEDLISEDPSAFLFGGQNGGTMDNVVYPTTSIERNGDVVNLSKLREYKIEASINTVSGQVTTQFINANNSNILGLQDKDGKRILVEGVSSERFLLNQSIYSSWITGPVGPVALSFINYFISAEDGSRVNAFFIEDNVVVPISTIFLVPTTWYTDCDNGKSRIVTSPLSSLCAVACAAQSIETNQKKFLACGKQQGVGPCGKEPILGFSTDKECKIGFRYEYCLRPTRCNGTCQSACSDNAVCVFTPNKSGGTYSCTGGNGNSSGTACFLDQDCCPNGLFECDQSCVKGRCEKQVIPKKEEDILIVIAIVVGITVVGILVFVFFLYSKSDKSKKSSSTKSK